MSPEHSWKNGIWRSYFSAPHKWMSCLTEYMVRPLYCVCVCVCLLNVVSSHSGWNFSPVSVLCCPLRFSVWVKLLPHWDQCFNCFLVSILWCHLFFFFGPPPSSLIGGPWTCFIFTFPSLFTGVRWDVSFRWSSGDFSNTASHLYECPGVVWDVPLE